MKYILGLLLVCVGFWCGVAHTMATRPVQQYRTVVTVQPASILKTENCMETVRTCYARKRSARIMGPE